MQHYGFTDLRVSHAHGIGNEDSVWPSFTDIMTIPPSVVRRAYQDAESGQNSAFFYVRRFVHNVTGASEFVWTAGERRARTRVRSFQPSAREIRAPPCVTTVFRHFASL